MAAASIAAFGVVPRRGIVKIPLPLPPSLCCGLADCQRERGRGPWKSGQRHLQALDHLRKRHPIRGSSELRVFYFCQKCGLEFESFISGGRHARGCTYQQDDSRQSLDNAGVSSAGESFASNNVTQPEERRAVYADTRIEENRLILLYPGQPSRCSMCEHTFASTMFHAMNSMFRHMEMDHGLRGLKKWWKCSLCAYQQWCR